jgi:hypothetical protein
MPQFSTPARTITKIRFLISGPSAGHAAMTCRRSGTIVGQPTQTAAHSASPNFAGSTEPVILQDFMPDSSSPVGVILLSSTLRLVEIEAGEAFSTIAGYLAARVKALAAFQASARIGSTRF